LFDFSLQHWSEKLLNLCHQHESLFLLQHARQRAKKSDNFAATGGSGYETIPEGIQSAGSVPSPQCSQALGGPTFLRLRTGKVSLTIILQIS
jgi:hypothetical protein